MIRFDNIIKKYEDLTALHGLSFEVPRAELFGLIGPDGSGKTSLMRILVSLLLPDAGQAFLNGHDVVKDYRYVRRNIGYMPGSFSLYQDLSVRENLDFFASIYGTTVEENYHLIHDIYKMLEPFESRRAGDLSGGMKQKLALSCALIHKPEVLVLDEPTTGVDAVSRKEFWEMLHRLQADGLTILVSTPYMDEAEVCDRVALMQQGKILDNDRPDEIVNRYRNQLYAVSATERHKLISLLRERADIKSVFPFGAELHIASNEPLDEKEVEQWLIGHNLHNVVVGRTDAGIEDCFMDLMSENQSTNAGDVQNTGQ